MSQDQAKPKSDVNWKKALVAVAIAAVIGFIPPPAGLTVDTMKYIGIFAAMVVGLLIGAGPDWMVATACALSMVALKLAPLSKVMSNYSGGTVWMLLAAMGFAGCVVKSGLMRRIAFNVLKLFPPSFGGQVLAISAACIVITPLIPSTSAKLAIMCPLTASIADETGIEPHSKGLTGLWFAMFNIVFTGAFAVLSGSSANFVILGVLPAEEAAKFTWTYWFQASFVWWIIFVAACIAVSIFFLRPDKPINMSKEFIQLQLAECGPMSSAEKFCALVLVGAITLWVTESMHGINATVVAWMAFFAMMVRGLWTKSEVGKLPWALILFVGSMLGVADHMSASGLNDWLGEVLGPVIGRFIPNSFVFVIVLVVVSWIIRLGVDLFSIIPISLAIFAPVASIMGINLWLVVWIAFVNTQGWILPHNQIQLIQATGMMGGVVEHKDVQPLTWVYMIICLGATLASVPLWTTMGLM